jgi:hypothetical protein
MLPCIVSRVDAIADLLYGLIDVNGLPHWHSLIVLYI